MKFEDIRKMPIKEQIEYLEKELIKVYQQEKRLAADLKVLKLMNHKGKEDE